MQGDAAAARKEGMRANPADDSSSPLSQVDSRPAKVGTWSDPARRVLRERYLTRKGDDVVETPEEMCWRVAQSIAAGEARYGRSPAAVQEVATAFYEMMVDGYFLPNSPTLMNAGKNNGLQYSACYVLPVGDSMEEIFDAVKDAAIIHKSGGGCIAEDARVWTTFCGLEPIEVLVNRATSDGRRGQRRGAGVVYDVSDLDIRTLSMNPLTGESGLRRVTHVWRFDVPPDQQSLVETREGIEVQTSAWHPFMVVRPEGLMEVRADALVPGDVILGPERPDAYWPYQSPRRVGDRELDESLGWLVGFTLGDGSFGYVPSLRQYRLRWFSGRRDVLDKVRSVLAGRGIHVSVQKDARGLLSVSTLTQRFVLNMLEACGLEKIGPKDDRVRVPDAITKSPLSVIRAFVAGLLDSDGYVDQDGSPSYSSVSRELAEDLAGLVSLLGYQPSVSSKEPRGKGTRTVYTVLLCPLPQVNVLRADLGAYLASEQRLSRLRSTSRKRWALRLPFGAWRDRLRRIGFDRARPGSGPGAGAAEFSRWSCNRYRRCRRDDLSRIADLVASRDEALGRLLKRTAAHGLEVSAVRRAPAPKTYYDLSVEDWNTYAAGTHGLAMIHNTGFAFSRLRPKDDVVASTGGRASGPVSFLRVFNAATEAVKQGGTRRGANMGILRIDHPDILEFIECKLDGGITNFNISVAATDAFMSALSNGEEYDLINPHTRQPVRRLSAREVFDRIVRAAWRTGDPGMVFIDRINASPANPTPEIGMIEATNPCIAGDALVASDRGLLQMEELVSRYGEGGVAVQVDQRLLPSRLMIWEGTHNVPLSSYGHGCLPISRAFRSGTRETVTIRTKAGFELTCTPDHRLMTTRGWVAAGDLRLGVDRVLIQSAPGLFADDPKLPFPVQNEFQGANGRAYRHRLPDVWTRDLGVVLGWLVGDGWLHAGDRNCRVGFTFGAADGPMLHHVKSVVDGWYGRAVRPVLRARQVWHLSYHGKFFVDFFRALGVRAVKAEDKAVPESLFTAPRDAVVGFLQGLFTADGTVRNNPMTNSAWIALTSKSRTLLRGVQLLLLNLGIKSQILDRGRPPRAGLFPAAGPDGGRSYGSEGVLFELGIFGRSREVFRQEVGFLNAKRKRLGAVRYRGFCAQKFEDLVVAREDAGVRSVYDLTEPQSHSMVANGLVIHQCGEQPLLGNEACNLGSLNVSKFARPGADGAWTIDWDEMERIVRLSVRFLDDVIEMNPYPLPAIDATVKANRRIGLGVMGWADLLFTLGIPYDSEEAIDLAAQLMAFVREESHDQSAKLAEERGPFPNWSRSIHKQGRPMRNSTVTTIAPTGTISMIAGCSSGIEPIFALAFEHRVRQGDRERVLTFVNETFEAIARREGFYSEALMREIAKRGSLDGIPGLPARAERVFKTAHEIPFEWHVRHQAAFQRFTDNGVSKTINLPNGATEDDVANAYRMAWELGCLGITVFRDGCKGEQVLTVGVSAQKEKEALASIPASTRSQAVIRPRPHSLRGTTYRMETPIGTAFITVNETDDGEPFEVFVQVGKGGSDTMAVAEALGRLISLVLRLPSPFSARRRLEEVISQLSRIGGGQPTGFGASKVLSLPDALARTLAEHIGQVKPAGGAPLDGAEAGKRIGDLCKECGQATFVYEEGCKKCLSCGFNEC